MTEAKENAREYAVHEMDVFLNGSKQRNKFNHVIHQISDHAYGRGYQDGLNEAWAYCKELCSCAFGTFGMGMLDVLTEYTAEDAIAKMKRDEDICTEVEVGDEVIDPNGIKAVVTNVDTHRHILYPHNGKTWKVPNGVELKKTGARKTVSIGKYNFGELPF